MAATSKVFSTVDPEYLESSVDVFLDENNLSKKSIISINYSTLLLPSGEIVHSCLIIYEYKE